MRHWITALCATCAGIAAGPVTAAPPVDAVTLERIVDAGFNHGEVLETAAHLADQIGGRMTNSPAMREAERWTQWQFRNWGLGNVHTEGFDFGRGWWIEAAHARLVLPRPLEMHSIPVAWTPPTSGKLTAPVVVAPLRTERDFAAWKGKLAGKIVLVSWPEGPKDATEAPFKRLSDAEIQALAPYALPHFDPDDTTRLERLKFATTRDAFLASEGALAWVRMSYGEGRVVHGEGYDFRVNRTPKLPGVELAAEDYRRLARLAKVGEVRIELESLVHFEDADTKAYNVFAEIPGREPKAGYVMAGAHLDSWVAGDGAADNGAGSAVIMEAARILASLHVQPRRTIRFALWAGEEQGLFGSAAYVEQHLARRPPATDPALAEYGEYFTRDNFPIETLPGFGELAAYFNVDNGSGKIRGIHAEGNFGAAAILRDWLAPLASLGAGAVVAEPTGGTDHVLMSRLGLPAFQFIQDPLDYESRVHHTDLDVADHLRADDLRQASVVLATVLLDAAEYERPLPRRTLPTKPRPTDPFRYPEPSKP
jgi:hypothetical protein